MAVVLFGAMWATVTLGDAPAPEEIMETHLRMMRETVYVASYVVTMVTEFAGEEGPSLEGSFIIWCEYPRFRLEGTGLEGLFYPVEIIDLGAKVSYSWDPERGWAKHVLATDWLWILDPGAHPLMRRMRYTSVEEGVLGDTGVWIVRGELPPDSLGLIPRFEAEVWVDKGSYLDRRTRLYFELYFPGLEVISTSTAIVELTGYKDLRDIPDARFAVPDDAPPAPDSMGRVFPYPAPDLRGVTAAGEEITLADFRGRVVVLFFWDLGARPEEIGVNLALMEGLRMQGEEHGVSVVGIVEGDPGLIGSFLEEFGVAMPTITEYGEWAGPLGVEEPFTCVLIDPEGMVYAVTDPFSSLSLVLELLGEI
ncbi:peroxiredoxin family protein [Candidatus Bipolaricaulota sp. J31]